MDNQFINSPLLVNRSGVYTDPKEELIKKLEAKNTKLKTQLIKIQRAIEQRFGQEEQTGPKKRESIFQHEDNFEVLTKQLANTYKRIKMYEYEVNKLEEANRSVNLSQKSGQFEGIIKEKRAMSQKLKAKLIKEQRHVQDNIRKLEKDNQKQELQIHMKKLTDQAKFYKEKVKVFEEKEKIKATNMKKQYEAIKKFEQDLIEAGVAGGQLDEIKRTALNSIKPNPARKTMQQTRKNKEEPLMSGSQDQIQDRTRQHYQALLAEVALLQKMQNDHEKQMVKAFDDKVESVNKNMQSRNRLIECQNEIQNLEKEIQIIKGKVVPSNMKPTKPLRSLSSHQAQNPNKLLPAKPMMSSYLRSNRSNQLTKINTERSYHQ